MKILVVEDEKQLNDVIVRKLKIEGYTVDACFDGEEALSFIESIEYDAVVLDIMLPHIDGLSVLSQVRAKHIKTPIVLLTARSSVGDRIGGLDMGADDYLVKPFSLDELLARLRVVSRRTSQSYSHLLTLGDLVVDTQGKQVRRADKDIALSSKEYAILEYMIKNAEIVLCVSGLKPMSGIMIL